MNVRKLIFVSASASIALAALAANANSTESFPSSASFSIIYTFTTSAPAEPVDVGGGRDLTVNHYLATTFNDQGGGFLHLASGRCVNVRFTDRANHTVDTHGYCNFRDADGDVVFAEYTTGKPKPAQSITKTWTFTSGTGKYDGIQGSAEAFNSDNLDTTGAYQAAGKMTGSYAIRRTSEASEQGER